jgi:hypothetical protein
MGAKGKEDTKNTVGGRPEVVNGEEQDSVFRG